MNIEFSIFIIVILAIGFGWGFFARDLLEKIYSRNGRIYLDMAATNRNLEIAKAFIDAALERNKCA